MGLLLCSCKLIDWMSCQNEWQWMEWMEWAYSRINFLVFQKDLFFLSSNQRFMSKQQDDIIFFFCFPTFLIEQTFCEWKKVKCLQNSNYKCVTSKLNSNWIACPYVKNFKIFSSECLYFNLPPIDYLGISCGALQKVCSKLLKAE